MCTALSFDLYCTNFKCPHNLFWEELNLGREKIQMTDKALEIRTAAVGSYTRGLRRKLVMHGV